MCKIRGYCSAATVTAGLTNQPWIVTPSAPWNSISSGWTSPTRCFSHRFSSVKTVNDPPLVGTRQTSNGLVGVDARHRTVSSLGGICGAPQIPPSEETVLCLASTPTRPFEVCRVPTRGGSFTVLTDENRWLKQRVGLVQPELIEFQGAEGVTIQGWLVRPAVTVAAEQYPLILHIHGGPYLGWANTFHFQYQALAAAGFASLYINPRGSAGYGQAFARLRDYGENDFGDLMRGLDVVLEHGEADPSRLAVTGLSYGGFMTNWAITQTDRFAAALTVNGLASWVSMQSSSDLGGRWPGFEWGGNYWDSEELCETFRRHSPITYV